MNVLAGLLALGIQKKGLDEIGKGLDEEEENEE